MMEKDQESQNQLHTRQSSTSLGLQSKFLFWVAFVLLFCCMGGAYLVYRHEKRLLEEAAIDKAQLVMAAVEAARSYIREELRPKMYEVLGPDAFVLEAMSTSYVGRAVMDRFKDTLPEYLWRRVAINARNPEFEPRAFEHRMIRHFSDQPQDEFWQGIEKIEGRSNFLYVRPVFFKESCMRCHGDPRTAPKELLEIYGSERGFGHQPGEIAGVSTVSIPVDVALSQIAERAMTVFGAGVMAVGILFAMIGFLFNRVVMHSLKQLLDVFRQGFWGEKELELLQEAAAKDEIGELTAAAKVMSDHLHKTRQKLERYAGRLEIMVAERTEELEASRQRLQEKVAARNRELKTMNTMAELITTAHRLEDVLPRILKQVLDLVPAEGAAIYMLKTNPLRLDLMSRENADQLELSLTLTTVQDRKAAKGSLPDLPSSLAEAADGNMSYFKCRRNGPCLNVPLFCRGQVLGVMSFVGLSYGEITDETSQLLFSIGRQTGITIESLQNLEKLVASKELLQSVFDGITDMVVLLDRNMSIRMVNQAHLDYFGITEEEAFKRNCGHEPVCQTCPLYHCDQTVVLETKKPYTEEVGSQTGEIFQVYFYPIIDERNEVISIVRFAKDITADKEVERRIQQTEKLASLGQLSAGVAHEMNNPLGVILCYTDLLKDQLDDRPQGLKDVATIEKHAQTCQRIAADLLKFARGQSSERQLTYLNPTIEEVAQIVGPQFKRRRLDLELDLAPDLPRLYLDVDKLKQVYLNLLMNALHAMDPPGRVRVTTRLMEPDGVEIQFLDSGTGIKPEIMEKIFDPFFSTKKTGEGTGLGLSVSYGIVRDHGGEIKVESEPGQWTRFTITLPLDG